MEPPTPFPCGDFDVDLFPSQATIIEYMLCGNCKTRKPNDDFGTMPVSGKKYTVCNNCRDKKMCEHEKRKDHCRICSPQSYCEHDRNRNDCKLCDGNGICEHSRRRRLCKECDGAGICVHGRQRAQCIPCAGTSVCVHGRMRHTCKDCGGSSICPHGRERRICKDCDPAGHLRSIVSRRIHSALKSQKNKRSLEYLGCDIETFRAHIESTFKLGMTWVNYGKWEIDHIVPVMYRVDGKPPSLEVVAQRLHYTNTQALWAADNHAKQNRFIG